MQRVCIKAFVLRSVPYGENQRLLELLTDKGSILTVSARPGRGGRGLSALCQEFIFGEFELFENRGRWQLNGGEVRHSFPGLGLEWDRLISASHLAEVFLDILRQQTNQPSSYSLWAYALERLAVGEDPLLSVRIAQFRLLADSGFCPWLDNCVFCHRDAAHYDFSFSAGGIICKTKDCRDQDIHGDQMPISYALHDCLKYIVSSRYSRLFHFALNESMRNDLMQISDRWLRRIMEKDYHRMLMVDELSEFSEMVLLHRIKESADHLPTRKERNDEI